MNKVSFMTYLTYDVHNPRHVYAGVLFWKGVLGSSKHCLKVHYATFLWAYSIKNKDTELLVQETSFGRANVIF